MVVSGPLQSWIINANTRAAIPFHPGNKPPKAPCPRCVKDSADSAPRELFAIRSVSKGGLDPVIPDEWRYCPPVKLDTTIPGMEALRVSCVHAWLHMLANQVDSFNTWPCLTTHNRQGYTGRLRNANFWLRKRHTAKSASLGFKHRLMLKNSDCATRTLRSLMRS
jgi:hypothetical protein